MTFSLIVAGLILLLFALAYATKRRFGVLALSLLAGALLAEMWSETVTPYVANSGISLISPPLINVVSFVITLVPSFFLLFSGPSAFKKHQQLGGAFVYALLAVSLLFDTLKSAIVMDDFAKNVASQVEPYLPIVITVCIVLALLDVFATHTRKFDSRKKKH